VQGAAPALRHLRAPRPLRLCGRPPDRAIQRNAGAPRDILSARLRKLVSAGLLERRQYHGDLTPVQAG
jgi:DNA-binding HxlR family transcriptional regulator